MEQIKQTLSLPASHYRSSTKTTTKSFPARQRPSGGSKPSEHDKDLKHLKESGKCVSITLMSGNVIPSAVIIGGDKYSIKIRTSSGDSTIFKHAIESFTKR